MAENDDSSIFEFLSDNETETASTQPIPLLNEDASADLLDDESDSEIWGWLHPTRNSKLRSVALENEQTIFGRNPRCDIVFLEEEFHDSTLFSAVSNKQFKIVRKRDPDNGQPVYLHDLSSNGTFVNKKKVGKGMKVLLTTNDEITFIFPSTRGYIFLDTDSINDFMPLRMKKKFNLKIELGSGAYGEVRLAFDKEKNKDVAIKKIKKRHGKESLIHNEIKILQKLKHPFIVSMEEVYDFTNSVFIVLEYVPGGTLSDKLTTSIKLLDAEAKLIFYQLTLALKYLHSQGVAHRDLKPSNVLIATYEEGDLVKVSDFGLSKLSDSQTNTELKTACGTLSYTAPEVLMTRFLGSYTHGVDVWSLGVTLFLCLSGTHPFTSERCEMTVTDQIVRGSYIMTREKWRGICHKSINLTRRMLEVDPDKRITIPEILNHHWFQDETTKNKVQQLMKCGAEGKENVCTENQRSSKRPRCDNSCATFSKS